ncbi:MAG TPA: hypothetical protein VKQ72_12795 [Aggregatilineales bacterium]|nr:hypothetical protein [Aggregatilineales bacterium]
MLPDQSVKSDVVIACDPTAIPAEQRDQWAASGKLVFAAVEEVREFPDGYGLRLPADSAMLLKVAEYISNERLCCPFLRFEIDIQPNRGPIWVRLTGGEAVKEYIGRVVAESGLIREAVARAAGLT